MPRQDILKFQMRNMGPPPFPGPQQDTEKLRGKLKVTDFKTDFGGNLGDK